MYGYDYPKRMIYGACIDKKEVHMLDDAIPIIVSYKYYDRFRKVNLPNKRIFYYCDRVYENTIDLFNNLYNVEALQYTFIQYDGSLSLFVIKLKNDAYFFLPIVTPLMYYILEDMEEGKLLVKKDNLIELSQKDIYDLDAIINCLYYTDPNSLS